jgi:hypothetical protein
MKHQIPNDKNVIYSTENKILTSFEIFHKNSKLSSTNPRTLHAITCVICIKVCHVANVRVLYLFLPFCVVLSSAEMYDKIIKDNTLGHVEKHARTFWPLKVTQHKPFPNRQTQPAPCTALYCVWHCCHL